MKKVLVTVYLKPEILDPQGRAIHGALSKLGLVGLVDVRQGKQFSLFFKNDEHVQQNQLIETLANELLSNPVIENYSIEVVDVT